MKDRALFLSTPRLRRAAAMAAITALTALAGCAGSPPQAAAMAPHAAHATAATNEGISPSFTVSGAVGKRATFDLAALQAQPAVTLTVGSNTYTGVSLWTLLNDASVGLKPDTAVRNPVLSMYAVVVGSDGYRAVVSLAEIAPESGNRMALVAYSLNGTPLGRNGMARLVVAGDVKPGRSVARLAAIEVFAAQPSGR
ncbi:molybdopterin-dependent oxidoreductase [Variovorax sp. YR266]|uniref:molybdopterin-dependent oxidoreductase n=1 Tax=Variovorax sp. YR266 TaxID=1884386 RepID=UPI000B035075|nr:molybdopterin-dependent oxidoreductase [Variovorax sp. YR266]